MISVHEKKPGPRGIDLARAAAIFLFVFAMYFVGYSRTLPPTADEMIDFGLAQSMAKWQIFSIDQVSTVGPNPEEFGLGGHRYSKYGPLQAVLSVPLFWLAQRLPIGAVDTVLLLNHLVTALSMALLFLLVRRMGYGPGVALGITALVAFGTPLWIHSKRYFGEPTITLCIIATVAAAYVAATTRARKWLILAGLAFGAAVASKYVNGLLLAPVPLYLVWATASPPRPPSIGNGEGEGDGRSRPVRPSPPRQLRPAIAALIYFGIGVAPVAALLILYDLTRFGNPVASGYAHWESFSTPIWVGVAGFLFSPGKSIFVYTPLLLMVPFVGWSFARRFPGFAAMLGAIIVLHLGLYGSWWVWWGAWAWGPRFIVPILPLMALFLAEGLARLGSPPLAGTFSRDGAGDTPLLASPPRGERDYPRYTGAGRVGHQPPRMQLPSPRGGGTEGGVTPGDARDKSIPASEQVSSVHWLPRPLLLAIVIVLGALSFVIQVLGISVDHTVYLVSLLPLNPKPDTLTLYDLRYQPILHQIPLMTRQWLDFAWIERTGPSAVNAPALTAVLVSAAAAAIGFVVVWLARGWSRWLPALALVAIVVAGGVFQALKVYDQTVDPTTAAVVQALAAAPNDTGIVQLIPSDVVPYDNWQKRPLPEIGWIEEPHPNPIIVKRLRDFATAYPRLWVITQTPAKVPSNGIEGMLDRSLVQVGDTTVGKFRLLRYLTNPASAGFVNGQWQFGEGIKLAGFVVTGGPPTPGGTVNLTLEWQTDAAARNRADYTVFVHLVDANGKLVAQHDNPPASGYVPTSGWTPGQVVYDDHAIVVPADAPSGLHLVQVGLYLPSNGKRLSLIGPDGKAKGDTVTLDLSQK